jgi:hypothetical protein
LRMLAIIPGDVLKGGFETRPYRLNAKS